MIILFLAIFLGQANADLAHHYKFAQEIAVGGEGGWDYLSIDPIGRRLYLAQSTRVVVIDLDKNKIVGEISNTPGVHGFAIARELGRGFSSNGKENQVSVVDLKTLKTLSKIAVGENPDAIAYDSKHKEVYVFNGRGKSATVINAKTAKTVTTLALPGKPEFMAVDIIADRVFVNIEDLNQVVAIDTVKNKIVNTWTLAPGLAPTGMAIDLVNHRLFVGCKDNSVLEMLDRGTGKILSTVPIGKHVDAVAFDPATQTIFSSNGEGTVTIVDEETPQKMTVVQTLVTEPGARTMALDPKTHRIYLTSARFEPAVEGQRPKVIPGTLRVLVYGQGN